MKGFPAIPEILSMLEKVRLVNEKWNFPHPYPCHR